MLKIFQRSCCFIALVVITFSAVIVARGQDYHWHCTFARPAYSVAFNPLSGGRVIFTSTPESQSIMRSDDGGEHWHASQPLDQPTPDIHQIYCLPSDTNIVFALSGQRFHESPALYRSTNGGATWATTPTLGGIDGEAIAYHASTDELYYGENFAGSVYKSGDHGKTWVQVGVQNSSVTLCSLAISPDNERVLLAGSEEGVLDRSTNEGTTWQVVYPADSVQSPEVPKVIFSDIAPNVAFAARWHSSNASLIMTRDAGQNWSAIASPDPHVWALEIDQRQHSTVNGMPQHLWTGLFTQYAPDTTAGGMIEETTDGGFSWHTTGFPKVAQPPSVWVIKYDTTSGTIAAATDSGVFIGHESTRGVATKIIERPTMLFYPNPATSSTTLVLANELTEGAGLELYDIVGRLVAQQKLSSGANILNVAGLRSGAYAAIIKNGETSRTLRLIVLPH